MEMIRQLLHIMVGLAITFGGLGLCLAFGMFAWIGVPILAVGLGVLSTAVDRVTVPTRR
jgi:hypothetical protein